MNFAHREELPKAVNLVSQSLFKSSYWLIHGCGSDLLSISQAALKMLM